MQAVGDLQGSWLLAYRLGKSASGFRFSASGCCCILRIVS